MMKDSSHPTLVGALPVKSCAASSRISICRSSEAYELEFPAWIKN
jgi:hypothetical protein